MSRDPIIDRLRSANPDRGVGISDQRLKLAILSEAPSWLQSERAGSTTWLLLSGLRARIAAGGLSVTAVLVALIVSLSGSTPNIAQAFPALASPAVLTPEALQQSMAAYGVGPHADGLDITAGHAVRTPWGHGYVLTSPGDRFVCLVAPGLNAADWGASCAQTDVARSSGTPPRLYAYDSATSTARLLALLPQDSTATIQTAGRSPQHTNLADGLLALDIKAPTTLDVTINGHTTTDQISPQDATTNPATVGQSGSGTATTSTASTGTPTTG